MIMDERDIIQLTRRDFLATAASGVGGLALASLFQADGLLECDGARLMRRLLEHRSETEKLAFPRFIDDHFLMVFVHGSDPHLSGHHHVGLPAGIAYLVDPLPRRESLDFHLAGKHRLGKWVQMRMAVNLIIEWAAGLIPFVGALVDAGYKANLRNLAILETAAGRR